MKRLLQRLRTLQDDELMPILAAGKGATPAQLTDALLIAVATVLHESGIVVAPSGPEKRRFVDSYAPRGLREVPRR